MSLPSWTECDGCVHRCVTPKQILSVALVCFSNFIIIIIDSPLATSKAAGEGGGGDNDDNNNNDEDEDGRSEAGPPSTGSRLMREHRDFGSEAESVP